MAVLQFGIASKLTSHWPWPLEENDLDVLETGIDSNGDNNFIPTLAII